MSTTENQRPERGADALAQSRLRALLAMGRRQVFADGDAPSPRPDTSGLDAPTEVLVTLAAVIALGGPPAAYEGIVRAGRSHGITDDQFVGTLIAVAPTIGISRLVSATTSVSHALGYDLEEAFECLDAAADGHDRQRPSVEGRAHDSRT